MATAIHQDSGRIAAKMTENGIRSYRGQNPTDLGLESREILITIVTAIVAEIVLDSAPKLVGFQA